MDDPETISDREFLIAYRRPDGEPGDPATDALGAETERRDIDA